MTEVPIKAAAAAFRRDLLTCACCGALVAQRPHAARRRNPDAGDALANLLTFQGDGTRPWDPDDHYARVDSGLDPTDAARGFTVPPGQDPALVPVMVAVPRWGYAAVWLTRDGKRTADDPREVAA